MQKVYSFFVAQLFFTVLFLTSVYAQTPMWHWARQGQTQAGIAAGGRINTDAEGNIYTFGGSLAGISFGNVTLDEGDFLVKHDPQGNLLSANNIPLGNGIRDIAGNWYYATAFLDTISIGSQTFVARGYGDVLIAKTDSAGNLLWAQQAGGAANPTNPPWPTFGFEDGAQAIGLDASGNIYVTGHFDLSANAPILFGADTLHFTTPGSGYSEISFLAKLNAAGDLLWIHKIQDHGTDAAQSLAVLPSGGCYVAGVFIPGFEPYIGDTLTSNGGQDICFARYDADGNLLWAKSLGGPETEYSADIAATAQGDLILAAAFQDTVQVGAFSVSTYPNKTQTLLLKVDGAGNILWVNQLTGAGQASDPIIVLDSANNCYLASNTIGTVKVGQQNFFSGSAYDPLISKWDAAGNPVWGIKPGGGGNDFPSDLALSPDQTSLYLSGLFENSLTFGSQTLQTGSFGNFFLAKLQGILTAAPEWVTELGFSVYPNPAQRQLHLQLPQSLEGATARLLTATGQEVFAQPLVSSSEAVLQLPALPQGLYILSVETEKQVLRRKVVIQ